MNDGMNKTTLGPDCRISGELTLDNDAVIMGQFSGNLKVTGMLELSESSEVTGTVIAGTLRLAGRVEADIIAEDGIEILPGGEFTGRLFASQIHVAEGATFNGDIAIGPNAVEQAYRQLGQEPSQRTRPAQTQSHAMEEAHDEDFDADDQVNTMPNTVSSVLKRRRSNGNGRALATNGTANGKGKH